MAIELKNSKSEHIKEEVFSEEGLCRNAESDLTDSTSEKYPSKIKCEPEDDPTSDAPTCAQFIKTEPLETSEVQPEEEHQHQTVERTSNVLTHEKEEPPTLDRKVEARLRESKKLLIQRKTDIQMLTGKTTGPILYTCSFCPYQNSKKKNVAKHALIHNKFKEFKCDLCPYECHWKSWMVRHKQRHEAQPRLYKCDQCDYEARFKVCLERHIMNHAKLKPFACPLCNYRGNSKGYLRSHMTTHSKIKPFACPKCDYSCTRKKYLFIHLKSHSLSKLRRPSVPFSAKMISGGFQCTLCEYQCMRKSTLQTHLKRHFSREEYPCDLCSYKTDRKDLLDSHKLTHSAFKKFQCTMCEFKSHWSHCLRRHMFVKHLNFRPYKCAECEYTTADKSNLKKHVKSHLEVLYCEACEMDFKTKSNFTRHKNKFHKNDEEEMHVPTTLDEVVSSSLKDLILFPRLK